MGRRVLLIAFHFPPAVGSSGVHRGYSLARYLPDAGWEPIVLTARAGAHPAVGHSQEENLPPELRVFRTLAFDAARHMSLAGVYPGWLAWPDRWVSWFPTAVLRAVSLVRKYKPQVLWSTYPIATSHLIGLAVSKITEVPWVADFRDSMMDASYPPSGIRRNIFRQIERKTVHRAARVVFTAPGTRDMYADRYSDLPDSHWHLVLNGFDEESFQKAESLIHERDWKKTIILHSGVIYPEERDPTALFLAIAELKRKGCLSSATCEIRLRASGHDGRFEPKLRELGIEDVVQLLPAINYEQALAEMMSVDGLLLLQASSCNHQIPAKLYEYVRAGRPVLALTDECGDTASLLRELCDATIAPLGSAQKISSAVIQFIKKIKEVPNCNNVDVISTYSRRAQVCRTAQIFDMLVPEERSNK